jgi:hypothetical protein
MQQSPAFTVYIDGEVIDGPETCHAIMKREESSITEYVNHESDNEVVTVAKPKNTGEPYPDEPTSPPILGIVAWVIIFFVLIIVAWMIFSPDEVEPYDPFIAELVALVQEDLNLDSTYEMTDGGIVNLELKDTHVRCVIVSDQPMTVDIFLNGNFVPPSYEMKAYQRLYLDTLIDNYGERYTARCTARNYETRMAYLYKHSIGFLNP